MASISHLRSFQAIEAVLRTGSLKNAATELSVTPAAVGQRIKALEDYLGLELLVRGRSGIRPTRELQTAISHLTVAFERLGAAADLLDFQKADEIHIVADSDWAELWLAPRLGAYRKTVPNMRFCINGVGDAKLRLGKADCEIRFDKPSLGTGERVLFRDYLVPVGSRETTRRIAKLPSARRLEDFPLLHLDCYRNDPEALGWPQWIERFGHRSSDPGRGIRYQRIVHALEAVRSDSGFLLCGIGLLREEIRDDTVCLPFDVAEGSWTGHCYVAVFRQSAMRRLQIRRFRDWLVEESEVTREALEKLSAGTSQPSGRRRQHGASIT